MAYRLFIRSKQKHRRRRTLEDKWKQKNTLKFRAANSMYKRQKNKTSSCLFRTVALWLHGATTSKLHLRWQESDSNPFWSRANKWERLRLVHEFRTVEEFLVKFIYLAFIYSGEQFKTKFLFTNAACKFLTIFPSEVTYFFKHFLKLSILILKSSILAV